jgi:hypothetical protein
MASIAGLRRMVLAAMFSVAAVGVAVGGASAADQPNQTYLTQPQFTSDHSSD